MSLEQGFQNTILDMLQKMIDDHRNKIQSGGVNPENPQLVQGQRYPARQIGENLEVFYEVDGNNLKSVNYNKDKQEKFINIIETPNIGNKQINEWAKEKLEEKKSESPEVETMIERDETRTVETVTKEIQMPVDENAELIDDKPTPGRNQLSIKNTSIYINNIENPVMKKGYKPVNGESLDINEFISCNGTLILEYNNVKVPIEFTLTKDVKLLNEKDKQDILGEN